MPTSRISAHILAGLNPGLSRGLNSGFMGGAAQQAGYNQGVGLQSKLAQALATTRLTTAKADDLERQAGMQAPDALRENAMLGAGVPLNAGPDVADALATGRLSPKFDPLPEDVAGPSLPTPDWAPKLGAVAQRLAAAQTALALGDKNSANVSKVIGEDRNRALSDDIIAGRADPTAVARGEYAVSGKAPYAFNEYGVGNQLTGQVDASGVPAQNFAARRQSEIAENQAQAGSARASAANSYAAADQHRASTDRIRATPIATPAGHAKPPSGYRYIQNAEGDVQLEPIPGGPKDTSNSLGKAMPAGAAKGYLENADALQKIDRTIQLLEGNNVDGALGDTAATGLKGYLPNGLLSRIDPKGVDARAAVADISSAVIHDRSGANVTASESPRLMPFIPLATDSQDVVVKKSKAFRAEYARILEEQGNFYRSSGYNVPDVAQPKPRGAVAPGGGGVRPAAGPTPGAVQGGYRFRGGNPADPASWEKVQ